MEKIVAEREIRIGPTATTPGGVQADGLSGKAAFRASGVAGQRRRLFLRAGFDCAILIGAMFAAAAIAGNGRRALDYILVAAAVGLPLYVRRRGADLRRLARENQWRTTWVAGRGMPLADWRRGLPISGWDERRR